MSVTPGASRADYLQGVLEYGTGAVGALAACQCEYVDKVESSQLRLLEEHRLRLQVVDACRQAMKTAKLSAADKAPGKALPLPAAQAIIQTAIGEIEASHVSSDESVQ